MESLTCHASCRSFQILSVLLFLACLAFFWQLTVQLFRRDYVCRRHADADRSIDAVGRGELARLALAEREN